MDVTNIPFAKHIGIQSTQQRLRLEPKEMLYNHMGSFHAGALYTLAETQSGTILKDTFPQFQHRVVALLRSATTKYKKPAMSTVYAEGSISDDEKLKFIEQLKRRSRATIMINIILYDTEDTVIMEANFTWFVQLTV